MAYFGGAGVGARGRMHAWVSRSTQGLRERLRCEPHGLRFGTPLAPHVAEASDVKDERMRAELAAIGQVPPYILTNSSLWSIINRMPKFILFPCECLRSSAHVHQRRIMANITSCQRLC